MPDTRLYNTNDIDNGGAAVSVCGSPTLAFAIVSSANGSLEASKCQSGFYFAVIHNNSYIPKRPNSGLTSNRSN